MKIGQHETFKSDGKDFTQRFCRVCGIAMTVSTGNLSCPPWESSQRGDAPKPGNHVGAGVVKELKDIEDSLLVCVEFRETPSDGCLKALRQLIVKLEGQTGN